MGKTNNLKQRAEELLEQLDNTRTLTAGGYPCEYTIEHGKVYMARCEDGQPTLTHMALTEFIDYAEGVLYG